MKCNFKYIMVAGFLLAPAAFSYASCPASPIDSLKKEHNLKEVEIKGFGAKRNVEAAELGRASITREAIEKLPTLFGEPDVVKSLQLQPGVVQGVEGFTGLYVHGGDNDENLFLYEGLPLYQVSHLGGLFSSFNVATVSRADFYKSFFPSRYGGRISSITDISMREADFEEYHGRLSMGLLSANAYLTGPIIKDRTAFSVGVRRSWIDVVSLPILAIYNATKKKNGEKKTFSYNFLDFNARIDHKISSKASAHVIGYYGHDYLKFGDREFEGSADYTRYENGQWITTKEESDTHFYDEDTNRMSWGNWGVVGAFDCFLGPGKLTTSVYYSRYSSSYKQQNESQSDTSDPTTYSYNLRQADNSINDLGAKLGYYADISDAYGLSAGVGYVNHNFLPEDVYAHLKDKNSNYETQNGGSHIFANEAYAYFDNTITPWSWLSINAGVRGTLYHVRQHSFKSLEPRAAVRVSLTKDYSVKVGYARMTQCVQQISNNYISLPTDLWQPITDKLKPLRSDQITAGLFGALPHSMYFSVEGWYKDMRNLLEYREGMTVLDTETGWEEKLTSGKGWAYGVDLSLTKEAGAFTGTVGYSLLWNWRKFDELNDGAKFPSKFDNRHKINVNVCYKLNKKIEFNAGWTYMTGNRITLALYNYDVPGAMFPDAPAAGLGGSDESLRGVDYYGSRNNVRMPAYHRLDIGVSLTKEFKNGRKGVWNFGLYNAYCHMNALTIRKEVYASTYSSEGLVDEKKHFTTFSLLPVIPSVSYTYSF